MTPRERVRKALNHERPDRVPVDLGGTAATGITVPAYVALCRELGINPGEIRTFDPLQMLVEPAPAVRKALGMDTIGLALGGGHAAGWRPWTMPQGTTVQMPANFDLCKGDDGGWDIFIGGKRSATMAEGGYYFDAVEYAKWRSYDPKNLTDAMLRDIETRSRQAFDETDLAVVVTVPYTIFNGTSPDFLCALVLEKDEVHSHLEIWTDQVIACLSRLLDALGERAEAIFFSGDAGSQKSPLIGPELYREMILPHFKRIPEFMHRRSRTKFLYHTCGSVYRLMECFVELGVDAQNPLQVNAAEMEPERLVKQFGGRLVFWGGGCDTQHVLPRGSEAEVCAEVRSRLAAYTQTPGYVFASAHNVQPDVPPRNLLALLDEVRRWNDGHARP